MQECKLSNTSHIQYMNSIYMYVLLNLGFYAFYRIGSSIPRLGANLYINYLFQRAGCKDEAHGTGLSLTMETKEGFHRLTESSLVLFQEALQLINWAGLGEDIAPLRETG